MGFFRNQRGFVRCDRDVTRFNNGNRAGSCGYIKFLFRRERCIEYAIMRIELTITLPDTGTDVPRRANMRPKKIKADSNVTEASPSVIFSN